MRPGFLLENITRGGKTEHRKNLGGGRLNLRLILTQSGPIWANLGGKIAIESPEKLSDL